MEDESAYHDIELSVEEQQAAVAETGLDVAQFRGLHAFENLIDVRESHVDTYHTGVDPKAAAYITPLVAAALQRRKNLWDDLRCWKVANGRGWRLLNYDGTPVPKPDWRQEDF
jgi:hypothetical protein|nr:hypothetical protein NG677_19790 [Methylobacterium sp. OTU13CASTA1]